MGPARKDYSWRRTRSVVVSRESAPVKDVWTISGQFFAEQHAIPGSHPSYRHEEPASPNTCVTLLTGGLLVRIQPEEPIFSTTYRCDSKSKIWTILCGRVDFSCDLRFVTLRNASNFGDRAARPRLSIQAATGGTFLRKYVNANRLRDLSPSFCFRVRSILRRNQSWLVTRYRTDRVMAKHTVARCAPDRRSRRRRRVRPSRRRTHTRARASADHTCRVLVGGLRPARSYWYRFWMADGSGSRIGRTRTAPAPDAEAPGQFRVRELSGHLRRLAACVSSHDRRGRTRVRRLRPRLRATSGRFRLRSRDLSGRRTRRAPLRSAAARSGPLRRRRSGGGFSRADDACRLSRAVPRVPA